MVGCRLQPILLTAVLVLARGVSLSSLTHIEQCVRTRYHPLMGGCPHKRVRNDKRLSSEVKLHRLGVRRKHI